MKRLINFSLIAIFAMAQWQCIDPLEVQPGEANRLLVIEGGISTQPGPHLILISKSAQYGSRAVDEIKQETNATVWVRDEEGNQVFLSELKAGSYITPTGWRAEVGKSYTLRIELENGERYASLPEKVLPVPALEEIEPVFKVQPALDEFAQEVGIELYGRWQDPPDEENFYMWETKGEYKLLTYPQNFVSRDFFGNPIPSPKDCCELCYIKEEQVNSELRIFKDNFTNGSLQNEVLSYIPDDGGRFYETYMAVIDHSSLSKPAFQFFDILREQLSISGDIFDPPTATIRGNMINLDDPEASVIGYFRASDTHRDTLFLPASLITDPAAPRLVNDDCRVLDNSSTEIPPYWP